MTNTQILRGIISNLKNGHEEEAWDDCWLLPKKAENTIHCELSTHGAKAAITAADRFLGQI